MATANINGLNLHYEIMGNPDTDKTVVFMNGVMASAQSWMFQIPEFVKTGYKILIHDFRGQLLSDKPEGPYSFEDHVNDTKGLLDHLGIKKAHFIGTSYGGEVALYFALAHPKMMQSLSVIDSVSELDQVLTGFIKGWKSLAAKGEPEEFFWGMTPTIYGNTFIEKNQAFLAERARSVKEGAKDYLKGQIYLYDTFLGIDLTPRLKNIKCPTLILCGEEDYLKPLKFSRLMAQNIKGSEYVTIPDCGHVAILEKPQEVNTALLGFVIKHS